MKDRIEHLARVISVEEKVIRTEIVNKSACAACHAKGFCSSADSRTKVVEVQNDHLTDVQPGETVLLILDRSLGMKAAAISYMVPLLILLILLLYLPKYFESELYVGLGVLVALALYYSGIFLFRKKIGRKFIFRIEKINK